jgi:phosphoribosylanthranilate isomerase
MVRLKADTTYVVSGFSWTKKMFIKICGITRLEDALHAAEHGATALGFVFWPRSPRYVEPTVAARIIAELPNGVTPVGLFVNEQLDRIRDVVAETGVSTVQLHGEEPASYAASLATPVMRAISLDRGSETATWPIGTTFLVDAVDPIRRGGTGTRIDWKGAAALARGCRLVLAGGLTPENVAEAIEVVDPYGVDVSSGVEDAPGIKNADQVARFLASARSAFEQHEHHHR